MQDARGGLTITYNGEIYNYLELQADLAQMGHTFRSASDTEVILAAYRQWGVECVSRFNGMFALAIHDAQQHRLFLARDRAGEKPLYYALGGGAIRFASELKALLADPGFPRKIDRGALESYLSLGFVQGQQCILEGVYKIPPAHAATFDLESGAFTVWRYWQVPNAPPVGVGRAEELVQELERILSDAVQRQLVADVPVGVLLSGGVDSSLITAIAAKSTGRVKTFTVRFPGHGVYDETQHARLVASHFDTDHLELEAEDSTVDMLPALARQFDEPVADSSMIPTYLVTKLVRSHCTVALGGDGGDELFGGYPHYSRMLRLEWLARHLPYGVRKAVARQAALLPLGMKGRNWLHAVDSNFEDAVPVTAIHFDKLAINRLLPFDPAPPVSLEFKPVNAVNASLVERAMRRDFETYLPDDLLVKVDRASMLNSVEMRAPFLDHKLVEFAFGSVPSNLKVTTRSRKILLKKLAVKLLPAEFDARRKQGFSIPLSAWLRGGPWRELFADTLLMSKDSLFNREEAQSLIDGLDAGRANSERLFSLALFELWRREYGTNL